MSEERGGIDASASSSSEQGCDDDEIAKHAHRLDHDENPPFVAATVVCISTESMTIVDDAEPVHELAIAEILNDDEYENTTSSNASGPLSQPTTTQRSSYLTQRTSSLTSHTHSTNEVLSRQASFQVAQEIVHIDAVDEVPSDQPSTQQQLQQHDHDYDLDEEERKFNRLQRYCKIYLAVTLVMFVSGTVGIVFMSLNLGPFQAHSSSVTSPPIPLFPTLAPTTIPPTTAQPWISASPSDMPSCTGLFSKDSSTTVTQSGSDHFTMSDDGSTVVVANFNFSLSMSFLETFQILQRSETSAIRIESEQGYFLGDMCLSGDGSKLVLGVNTYPQQQSVESVGGALLVLEFVDGTVDWRVRHLLLTGGGSQGAVVHVATSVDGRTIAFTARSDDKYYIEVHLDDYEGNRLKQLGQRMNDTSFDSNIIVHLSGDGSTLFVVTGDNQVKAFKYSRGSWVQLGEAILYNGIAPKVHPSLDGTLVVLSSSFNFPASVFEVQENGTALTWYQVGELDITKSSQGQLAAISGDGRNVIVSEMLDDQQTTARLYRRSGSGFAQVQDLMLPGGIFRGMRLNPSGEQLVVAVDDELSTYRKDCSTGN